MVLDQKLENVVLWFYLTHPIFHQQLSTYMSLKSEDWALIVRAAATNSTISGRLSAALGPEM